MLSWLSGWLSLLAAFDAAYLAARNVVFGYPPED
jgi:hypothetical protein